MFFPGCIRYSGAEGSEGTTIRTGSKITRIFSFQIRISILPDSGCGNSTCRSRDWSTTFQNSKGAFKAHRSRAVAALGAAAGGARKFSKLNFEFQISYPNLKLTGLRLRQKQPL